MDVLKYQKTLEDMTSTSEEIMLLFEEGKKKITGQLAPYGNFWTKSLYSAEGKESFEEMTSKLSICSYEGDLKCTNSSKTIFFSYCFAK